MKSLTAAKCLAFFSSNFAARSPLVHRFFSSQNELLDDIDNDTASETLFDSNYHTFQTSSSSCKEHSWDKKYRERANKVVCGEDDTQKGGVRVYDNDRERVLAKLLLEAAFCKPELDEGGDDVVKEEDQKSLSVGIIGAPNAGKSALINLLVGSKVSAVSRKTNTTIHEVLGVMTKGNTQICFFDTPGLMLQKKGYPYKDVRARVENAWSTIDLYDITLVIFDVHRHITRPDTRVVKLIERIGERLKPEQKSVLCMNKIDLVEKTKDLLIVCDQFKNLTGYDRHFKISGLKGAGVNQLIQYLMEQAVKRPWDEDPMTMCEDHMKNVSLEVVRERLLDHVHQEIPYCVDHRLIDWKELKNGSLRIEQHLITHKLSQRKILVGKNGSKIARIGMEANEDLRSIFNREVHLILQVKQK